MLCDVRMGGVATTTTTCVFSMGRLLSHTRATIGVYD